MSTKAQIQADINSKLASGSTILASEHREVENELLDNFYPSEITENETTNSITINNADFDYVVKIVKIGRLVTISGTFEQKASSSGLSTIFNIDLTNSEFKPSETALSNPTDTFPTLAVGSGNIGSQQTTCGILGSGAFYLLGSSLTGEKGAFSITYNTFN